MRKSLPHDLCLSARVTRSLTNQRYAARKTPRVARERVDFPAFRRLLSWSVDSLAGDDTMTEEAPVRVVDVVLRLLGRR